jgi:hypothetical protein
VVPARHEEVLGEELKEIGKIKMLKNREKMHKKYQLEAEQREDGLDGEGAAVNEVACILFVGK